MIVEMAEGERVGRGDDRVELRQEWNLENELKIVLAFKCREYGATRSPLRRKAHFNRYN